MKNAMMKNGLLLGLFALLCTGLVALVNQQTAAKIQQQQKHELMRVLHQIIPDAMHDNELTSQCTLLQDKEALGTDSPLPAYIATQAGQAVAIALETIAPDGYNGQIKLIVGISAEGTVLGVRTLSHQETPGLGDKIELRKSGWVLSFAGKELGDEADERWRVKKDGGSFDQFTGATITPRAYVKAVKRALWYVKQHQQAIFRQPRNCEAQHD
ncbi:electron transport complex subunit RsxG [Shewanella salipaludis]